MRHLRKRPSASMGVALVALFIALGGTTYAATGGSFILDNANTAENSSALSSGVTTGPTLNVTNTGGRSAARFTANAGISPFSVSNTTKIGSLNSDLLDGFDSLNFMKVGSAASGDLTGTYPGPAIGTNAVGTSEVANNSLTGFDIDEATLAGVNADKVNGVRAYEIDYRTDGGPATTLDVLNAGGLRLTVGCFSGDLEVFAHTFRNNSLLSVFAAGNTLVFTDFDVIEPAAVDVVAQTFVELVRQAGV